VSSDDDMRSLVRRYFDALNSKDLDALDTLVAPDVKLESGRPGGRDGLKQEHATFHAAFPDVAHQVLETVVQDDRLAARVITRGTFLGEFLGHKPNGRQFAAGSVMVFHARAGCVRELYSVFDTVKMLQQLGLYRPVEEVPAGAAPQEVGNKTQPKRRRITRNPPGPSTHYSVEEVRRSPLDFMSGLVNEYGRIVRYRTDGRTTILINSPQAIQHVLHNRSSNYCKANTPDITMLKSMLGEGLLTTEGEVWREARQWLQPLFRYNRVKEYAATIVGTTKDMLDRWNVNSQSRRPVGIVGEMSRLTVEIFARCFLSMDFRSQSCEFGRAVEVLNRSIGLDDRTEGAQERFAAANTAIRRMVLQPLLARQLYDSGEEDLVARLLEFQRARHLAISTVADHAVTLMLAGHETTAKALSWTFALLALHPHRRRALAGELAANLAGRDATLDDLPRLPLTCATVHESLRLYPTVWLISRNTLQDDEIDSYHIPSGSLVLISPYLLHRDDELWPDAESFNPERFCRGEHETAWRQFRYIPFGAGPRHCIGRYFALLEMPLVLATVVQRTALSLVDEGTVVAEALVTLRPRSELNMMPSFAAQVVA
jgi:cytochrome P450/predicted ester cyclase